MLKLKRKEEAEPSALDCEERVLEVAGSLERRQTQPMIVPKENRLKLAQEAVEPPSV